MIKIKLLKVISMVCLCVFFQLFLKIWYGSNINWVVLGMKGGNTDDPNDVCECVCMCVYVHVCVCLAPRYRIRTVPLMASVRITQNDTISKVY